MSFLKISTSWSRFIMKWSIWSSTIFKVIGWRARVIRTHQNTCYICIDRLRRHIEGVCWKCSPLEWANRPMETQAWQSSTSTVFLYISTLVWRRVKVGGVCMKSSNPIQSNVDEGLYEKNKHLLHVECRFLPSRPYQTNLGSLTHDS